MDENTRLISVDFVNNTNTTRSMALNLFTSIMYPYSKRIKMEAPAHVSLLSAADYTSFTDSITDSKYNLVYDGQLRGQIKDENAVSTTAVVIGKNPGEKLHYSLKSSKAIRNGVMLLRYRSIDATTARLQIQVGDQLLQPTELKVAKDYTLATVAIKNIPEGTLGMRIKTLNKAKLALDALVLANDKDLPSIGFKEDVISYVPREIKTEVSNTAVFKFDDINGYYGLVWDDSLADRRVIVDDNPDRVLAYFDHLVKKEHRSSAKSRINGNNKGHFENLFSGPILVQPQQKRRQYFYISYGKDQKEVLDKVKAFKSRWKEADSIIEQQKQIANQWSVNKAGTPYLFSQQLMAATTLTNVNYPTFAGNQYLKHTTPGKRWSAFYTWDAGFIGLGYATLNLGRALESLNAYTMDSSEQSAFLEHGTPLPVQAYLYNELWNQTQNKEMLQYFYPRLKRYYNFLNGLEHSPTRKLQSNLVQTWDIFYNSGGWDDYSPQVFMHANKLAKSTAPTVNTSHQIRFAKLLMMAASELGYRNDIKQYEANIKDYSAALQKYSWNEASGYFGYVTHDKEGKAAGILKHASGANFNMGLDGISPLIAGICNQDQTRRILDNVFSKEHLWTDQGITAIDQSAPYYNKDGYWNGRVWMPHQWFIWKALLDVAEPQKAIQVAQTALNVWKRETDDSYNCWENFSVETGNGGGWHQFGALSSPVLNWFSSLYKPGTITHGFDIWPVSQSFGTDQSGFKGVFKLFNGSNNQSFSMLVCLNDNYEYAAICNGKELHLTKVLDGLYTFTITPGKRIIIFLV
ncbi:MGH1-like glycoside hydrolase domain-containing protein [Niabella hibiscisoli]|uniref:MGH1-like glycoside hydrolase domain-containing protein n=1 Tax=Niabella hibiscisoli TaxID=1825928 RepID=UPI001F10E1AB|nr:trehalase family glycosidase [Niabella hibiscisoli]MCH5720032.1 hypothetical protein [Niabella hibiscisoli]